MADERGERATPYPISTPGSFGSLGDIILGSQEFRAFNAWAQSKYGLDYIVLPAFYKSTPEYREWVALDRPTSSKARTRQAEFERTREIERDTRDYGVTPQDGQVVLPSGDTITEKYWLNQTPLSKKNIAEGTKKPDETEVVSAGGLTPPTPIDTKTYNIGGDEYTAEEIALGIPQTRMQEKERAEQLRISTAERATAQIYAGLGAGGRTEGPSELDRTRYEDWKERLLGELTQPRDWITRWQLQNKPNPYAMQETQQNLLDQQREENKRLDTMAKDIFDRMNDPNDSLSWASLADPANREGQAAASVMRANKLARERLTETEGRMAEQDAQRMQDITGVYGGSPAQPRAVIGGGFEIGDPGPSAPQRPTAPPTPRWLAKIVPELTTGQPVEQVQIPALAGSTLAGLPHTQREGLAGFMEYSGQSYQDMLDRIAMTQPKTPTVPTRWTPSRQR